MKAESISPNFTKISYAIKFFTLFSFVIPLFKWLQTYWGNFDSVSAINIFPLLGLWAFFLMWSHYIVGAIKQRYPEDYDYKLWYKRTSRIVLILIILHPAIVLINAASNGTSLLEYSGSANTRFILFGSFAWLMFMSYEIAGWLRDNQWVKNNKYIIDALNYVALTAIFIHAYRLGSFFDDGAYSILWWVMAIIFVGRIIDSYIYKFQNSKQ